MNQFPHNHCLAVSLLSLCLGLTGCALWNSESDTSSGETWQDVFGTKGPEVVDASRASVETVILEVAHIEQPLSDISMIDLLWKEFDEIGALDSETRRKLADNNLRVGIAGPKMPMSLQKLLQVDAAWREERSDGKLGSTLQAVTVFPTQPVHLHTIEPYEVCEMTIPKLNGVETVKFENVNCQFQIEAEKLQDGWVQLHFLPEIHHDTEALRRVATESGWQFQNGQKVQPIYDQKFSVTLNEGEVVVISAIEHRPNSLGHAMFIGDGYDDQIQKLLIIRLSDIRAARAHSSREVR